MKISIVKSIDAYLKKDYDETIRENKIGTYHVSDLANECLRWTWYRYIYPPTFDMVKAGIFMRGDIYEAWLAVEVLPKIYPDLKIDRQLEMNDRYELKNKEIEIQGHADIGVNNQVIEIKTIGAKTLDWLKDPKIENLRQVNYYASKLKKEGLLVYLTPETIFRKEFEVKPNTAMLEEMIIKAFTLDYHLTESKVPEATIHWACLDQDTPILGTEGVETISNLMVGDNIPVMSDVGPIFGTVNRIKDMGQKQTLKIGIEGRDIYCTPEHKFIAIVLERKNMEYKTPSGGRYNKEVNTWRLKDVEARQLTRDSGLIILNEVLNINMGLYRLWGCFVGDGYSTKKSGVGQKTEIVLSDRNHIRLYKELMDRFWGPTKILKYDGFSRLVIFTKKINAITRNMFYDGKTKIIPKEVFSSKREDIKSFLRGIVDADGYYNKQNRLYYIEMADPTLMNELRQLSIFCGLYTTRLYTRKRKHGLGRNKTYIMGLRFNSWDRNNRSYINGKDFIPNFEIPSYHMVSPIKYIERDSKRRVYDITVSPTPYFYINGIATHNCNKENRQSKLFCEYAQKCVKDNNCKLQELWKQKAENKYNKYRGGG